MGSNGTHRSHTRCHPYPIPPLVKVVFCFPSDDFYIYNFTRLDNSNHVLSESQVDRKRRKLCTAVQNIEFNTSKQLCILCPFF